MIATITSKGQVTLPAAIRNMLRLHAGDKLDFFVQDNGHIECVPIMEPPTSLKGMVPKPDKIVSLTEMDEAIAQGSFE